MKHDMNAMIWMEDTHLLNIMSVQSNGIETIDLRENKKWVIKESKLEDLFNTEFDFRSTEVGNSRVVGN